MKKAPIEKPPLGIKPKIFWEEERRRDLIEAILRYAKARHAIPHQWIKELIDLGGIEELRRLCE